MLKLPNRTSSPSLCISGTVCLIICEISLFVTATNREAILLETLREFGVARSEGLEVNQWIVFFSRSGWLLYLRISSISIYQISG